MVGRAFSRAFTPVNIQSGFKVAGIFPFDRDIFIDLEFLPSDVTDRFVPSAGTEILPNQNTNNYSTSSLKFRKDLHHLQINLF